MNTVITIDVLNASHFVKHYSRNGKSQVILTHMVRLALDANQTLSRVAASKDCNEKSNDPHEE